MRKKTSILYFLIIISAIGCSDNNDNAIISEQQYTIDVYVAGSMSGNACYFKNDQLVLLDNNNYENSFASEIFVSNNNIYVFGGGNDNCQTCIGSSLLWTNGVVTNLNVALSEPDFELFRLSDFYVYNDDIYFIGYLRNISDPTQLDMVYWKNGVKTIIIENSNFDGNVPSLIVSNDDVYIYLKNNSNQYEIRINETVQTISQTYGAVKLAAKDNEVYLYGQFLSSSDGFYYNINTGVETTLPFFVRNLDFDNEDIYTLALYSGGSFLEEILKNNSPFYQTEENFIVDDFVVVDGILYSIDRDIVNGGPQIVYANNSPIIEFSDGLLRDIYIVNN